MCMICVDLEKGKLTFKEGWRNLGEMHADIDEKHALVVKQNLINKMVEEQRENEKKQA